MYCRTCNHDLRIASGNRCPECGSSFDPGDVLTYRQRPRSLARAFGYTALIFAFWTLAAGIPLYFALWGSVPMTALIAAALSLPMTFLSFFWLGIYRYAVTYKS